MLAWGHWMRHKADTLAPAKTKRAANQSSTWQNSAPSVPQNSGNSTATSRSCKQHGPECVQLTNRVLGKLQPLGPHQAQHPGQCIAQPTGGGVGSLAQLGPAEKEWIGNRAARCEEAQQAASWPSVRQAGRNPCPPGTCPQPKHLHTKAVESHSSSASTVCMTNERRLPLLMAGVTSSRGRTAEGGLNQHCT